MASPTPYNRTYSFNDFQASNPSSPLPGVQVDNELENVEAAINGTQTALEDIRRSDGALKNGIVTVDSLSPQVAAGVGAGALASAQAAANSAGAAADSADAAAGSASAAASSASAASGYAGNALTSRNEAETQKTLAQTARTGAQTARDFAAAWATAAGSVDVDDGVNPIGKSAYHWAQVAEGAATGALPDGSVTETKLADAVSLARGAVVADRTTLKALDLDRHVAAYLAEPGREGQFIWQAGDYSEKVTADPQEGIYIAPDSDPSGASGAWVRSFGPLAFYDIRWFGAAPSATAAANVTAINACLAVAEAVFIPSATFQVNAKLSVTKRGQRIFGNGLKSAIQTTSTTADILVLENGVAAEVIVEDVVLRGAGVSASAGAGIRSEYAGNLQFRGVTVMDTFVGFYIDTRTNVSTGDVHLARCVAYDTVSTGFEINNCTQLYATTCSALSCGGTGFRITDGSACHLTNCLSLLNGVNGVQVRVVNNTSTDWHFFDQVECDGNGVDGFRLSDTRGIQASNCWSGTNDGLGWNFLAGNTHFMGVNCSARNNGTHGWTFVGLSHSTLSNCSATGNKRLGTADEAGFFFPTGANNIILDNCNAAETLITPRQAYGFRLDGSCAGININGGRATGNTVANYSNASSGGANRAKDIRGHATKTSGVSNMPTSGTAVVTHNLADTPIRVLITPTADTVGVRYWVSAMTSTTFTVSCNLGPSSAWAFAWEASSYQET